MTTHTVNPSTAQAALNAANPGDTFLCVSGLYSAMEIRRSGGSGYPITIKPAPNAKPLIRVGDNWSGVLIAASYITLMGFDIIGRAMLLKYADALAASKLPAGPRYSANGISVMAWPDYPTLRNVIIKGNRVSFMPGGGIATQCCDYLTIEDNTVHGCAWWSNYGQSGISVYASAHVDTRITTPKTIVRRNTCTGNRNHIPFSLTGKIEDGHGIIIDDNLRTHNPGKPAYVGKTLVQDNICASNHGMAICQYKSANVELLDNKDIDNDLGAAGV